MSQYFIPVNKTKKEFFTPWVIGGVGKLWEWCVNPQAGVLPYLLRRSNEGGGGDVFNHVPDPYYAGRWAGDEVYLVGDCDRSHLYQIAYENYLDIAEGLVAEYNQFVVVKRHQLIYNPPKTNFFSKG